MRAKDNGVKKMFCIKCGNQLPDDAEFCSKCGAPVPGYQAKNSGQNSGGNQNQETVIASSGVTELKCPGCGAPIKPVAGESVVTCEYCGTSVSLGSQGWKNVSKHTMLVLKVLDTDAVRAIIRKDLDRGLMNRHLFEESKEESLTISYVPYWIVPAGANSSYKYLDVAAEVGTMAMDAAVMGVAGDAMGGRNGGMFEGMMIGGMMGGGMNGNNAVRGGTYSHNYEYPVLGIKDKPHLQPEQYAFKLDQRIPFDPSKITKSIKVLNGDIDEDTSKQLAKSLIGQAQQRTIQAQHHHLEGLQTVVEPGTPELLHAPVWQAKYSHKKKEYWVVVDGSDGAVMRTDMDKLKE